MHHFLNRLLHTFLRVSRGCVFRYEFLSLYLSPCITVRETHFCHDGCRAYVSKERERSPEHGVLRATLLARLGQELLLLVPSRQGSRLCSRMHLTREIYYAPGQQLSFLGVRIPKGDIRGGGELRQCDVRVCLVRASGAWRIRKCTHQSTESTLVRHAVVHCAAVT